MHDDRHKDNILASILAGLEVEYEKLKAELKYEEKVNRFLHEQGKKQRQQMFLEKATPEIRDKEYLLEAVKRNDARIKQLEEALGMKEDLHQTYEQVSRKVSKSLTSRLDRTIEAIAEQKEKAHASHLKFEAQSQRSLQRVKKAITEQQAFSVLNKSLTSFKSSTSLSSNSSRTSLKSTLTSKAKIKVVSTSRKDSQAREEPSEHSFNFKKKPEPNYPRLKLFQYDPLPKNT